MKGSREWMQFGVHIRVKMPSLSFWTKLWLLCLRVFPWSKESDDSYLSCNLVIQCGPPPIVKGQCPILNPEIHWNKVMYQFQCFYLWNSPSALLPPLKSQPAHRIKKHTICNASMQPHSENSSCSHKPKNRPLWTEWKKLFVFSSSFKPQIELPLLLE